MGFLGGLMGRNRAATHALSGGRRSVLLQVSGVVGQVDAIDAAVQQWQKQNAGAVIEDLRVSTVSSELYGTGNKCVYMVQLIVL